MRLHAMLPVIGLLLVLKAAAEIPETSTIFPELTTTPKPKPKPKAVAEIPETSTIVPEAITTPKPKPKPKAAAEIPETSTIVPEAITTPKPKPKPKAVAEIPETSTIVPESRTPPPKPKPKPTAKGSWFKLYPETEIIDVFKPVLIPPLSRGINDTIRTTIEVLLNFPNNFAAIHRMLVEMGVVFPDLGKSFTSVSVGGNTIRLPKALAVRFRFHSLGQNFIIPRQASKLPAHISNSKRLLVRVLTVLRQLGAEFSLDDSGNIRGFTLFGRSQRFPQTLQSKPMTVEGRDYNVPADIKKFLSTYRKKPAELFKVQMALEAFGVRFSKSPEGNLPRATYRGEHYDIADTPVRHITIREQEYIIPIDLDSIFRSPLILQVGEILSALQRANMKLEVVEGTGLVRGVTASNVMFRLPVVLDLRFRMGGKTYIIPYDLSKLIAELEKRNMPSIIVSILYNRYGIVPVRDSESVVTALAFNGKEFPIKAQPKTVVVLGGYKYLLPTDADKMSTAVANKNVTPLRLLQVLQLAGYIFIPDPDGILRFIQKGADRIDLHLDIRLFAKLRDVKYRMPSDLPRLLDVVRGLTPEEVEMIMKQLRQYGVLVSRRGDRIFLMFNGIKYEVHVKSGRPSKPTVGVEIFVDDKLFRIPKDIDKFVSHAKKRGRTAVELVMDLLQSHGIKVDRSSDGDIASIEMDGKSYKVGDGGKSRESNGKGAGKEVSTRNNGRGGGSSSRARGRGGTESVSSGTGDSFSRSSSGVSSGERCNMDVRIRGQFFQLPRDMADLPKRLRNFKYAEVFFELVQKGATLFSDEGSNFYAYQFNGCHIVFPQRFRIMVKVDRTGKKFRVPGELGTLAKTLSTGEWNWKAVRNALRSAGLQVAGYAGPVTRFSFQGKSFRVR